MQGRAGVIATVRRFEGALCVVVFEDGAPQEFLRHGGWLSLSQNDKSVVGSVLPLGDSHRIILRVEGGCAHMTGGAPILVSLCPPADVPPLPPLEGFANLRIVPRLPEPELTFNVVTLMRNEESYRRMLRSFRD